MMMIFTLAKRINCILILINFKLFEDSHRGNKKANIENINNSNNDNFEFNLNFNFNHLSFF